MKVARKDLGKVSQAEMKTNERGLTPGSETEAWTKEEMEIKNAYAYIMGIAGEIFCHSHGAEKIKKRTEGIMTKRPVPMFIGLLRAFCHLPPRKKMVLPLKYW